mmetsp:Transcript_20357/g.26389  ORF Transcript_20357/g.26389 Transcript_20357/m.26389 type:complete len:94 (-) Transcript_20357:440-721(-)|eukprot:CAMPEP_0197290838 /NCGR_PEP_ID=MMETSP0890-20130614/10249_1 /TAXON_ID=44058 ORGANISM="Aureoumbra lagunensis, Strain CCMP1510" /NCGR_SAMPLE_ID=MMETSP0890 /ASSEMBLY_ACC=CAM_ASM_000533 /LENGTH=93 /DNA_ID=CAMNT_0042763167 /DNA_START=72 /DNA_END=353 /DNA_ORIENTATION=-
MRLFLLLLIIIGPGMALERSLNHGLAVRGGSFDDWREARETAEACGVEDCEKAVVGAIVGSCRYSLRLAKRIMTPPSFFRISRGGATNTTKTT